jgi:hypothetical protein
MDKGTKVQLKAMTKMMNHVKNTSHIKINIELFVANHWITEVNADIDLCGDRITRLK